MTPIVMNNIIGDDTKCVKTNQIIILQWRTLISVFLKQKIVTLEINSSFIKFCSH